ncbi:uncharacterized protein L199_008365 [Kwoniella botswanensis]|uniref:uncharacterized protein n=1 Tax=Kwoniella botswanensis TaxID=1268659 RepID=UPI00315CF4A2
MYFDLYLPFPLPPDIDDGQSKKSKKGKGKAVPTPTPSTPTPVKKDCWAGIESRDREGFVKKVALSGHLGYSVIGLTVSPHEPSNHVIPSPFSSGLPFPDLDPRSSSYASSSGSSSKTPLVQVSRYHMRLDDNRVHPLTSQNTNTLKNYDILSVAPTSEKAFQLACTDLSNPGPNQISIITLPLHERPFTFRFNWKQMRQAQRNGVVFELLYSPALYPPSSTSPETSRRYRQNFLSNAREVIRITGGKGVILSSGPNGDPSTGLRGALDIVNLATMIGMPSNLAKESISNTTKNVLLRAQARKTFKAVMSIPKLIPPVDDSDNSDMPSSKKRLSDTTDVEQGNNAKAKKVRV